MICISSPENDSLYTILAAVPATDQFVYCDWKFVYFLLSKKDDF